jgi:hypothetical protein
MCVCADPSEASRSGFTDRPDRAPGSQTPKGLAPALKHEPEAAPMPHFPSPVAFDTCGCPRLKSIASLCALEVLLHDGAA